jgi:hypothetical protein
MPRKPSAAVQQPAAAEQAAPLLPPLASAGSLTREEAQAAWCRPRMPQRYADLHVNYIVLGEGQDVLLGVTISIAARQQLTQAHHHAHALAARLHCRCSLPTGESGLGKTSFINNLISSFAVTKHGKQNDGCATSMVRFQADPASLRTVLEPMDIPESSRRLIIALQVCVLLL